MEFLEHIKLALIQSLQDLTVTISNFLPNIIIALTLLLFGLIVAWLTKWVIIRLSAGLDRVANVVRISSLPLLRNWPIGVIMGWTAFWLLILFFVTAAVESLGLPGLADWLGRFINNLPAYLLAIFIIFSGVWVGNFVNTRIQGIAPSGRKQQVAILGRGIRILIISFAVIGALSLAGLDVALFEYSLIILFTAVLAGISLAFGLGAGPTLANVISGRYLKRTYQVGQHIQINNIEGEILELLPTGVVLDTELGRTFIPAKMFAENASILLDNEDINVKQ